MNVHVHCESKDTLRHRLAYSVSKAGAEGNQFYQSDKSDIYHLYVDKIKSNGSNASIPDTLARVNLFKIQTWPWPAKMDLLLAIAQHHLWRTYKQCVNLHN